MKKYLVKRYVTRVYSCLVEADSQDEALEIVNEHVDLEECVYEDSCVEDDECLEVGENEEFDLPLYDECGNEIIAKKGI